MTSRHIPYSLVDGPDQFSFYGIPYAVPVHSKDRWSHARPATNLAECHEGPFRAHGNNGSSGNGNGGCWRVFPEGPRGQENCLSLDVFTSNVVYDLMPVVVYISGDDLHADVDQEIRPTSSKI
jgi:carboxylesterase type B